jgi:hypothetical protein
MTAKLESGAKSIADVVEQYTRELLTQVSGK